MCYLRGVVINVIYIHNYLPSKIITVVVYPRLITSNKVT